MERVLTVLSGQGELPSRTASAGRAGDHPRRLRAGPKPVSDESGSLSFYPVAWAGRSDGKERPLRLLSLPC